MPTADALHPVQLLLDLDEQCRSGLVRFEKGTTKRQLALRAGRLSHAESNVAAEHLVRLLMRRDLLERSDLNVVSLHMKSGKRSDEALLAAGLLAPSDVAE